MAECKKKNLNLNLNLNLEINIILSTASYVILGNPKLADNRLYTK